MTGWIMTTKLGRIGHGLFELLFWHVPGGSEEITKATSQTIQFSGRNFSQVPPDRSPERFCFTSLPHRLMES
jgi:hypothetical protein